jgi:hypothetical protein
MQELPSIIVAGAQHFKQCSTKSSMIFEPGR